MITYTLKIIEILNETDDARTFCFKKPTLKKIKYFPGQYITLIVTINNRKYKRPYSLSSAPDIDDTLNITVKRLQHGIVSNHLIDVIKEGDMLEVMEPMGEFIYQKETYAGKKIFLWGAGSGITPLMSILKDILNTGKQKVTLTYCNKNVDQTIFYNQLLQFKEQYPDRLLLNLFYTEEKKVGTKYGRINKNEIFEILNNATDLENSIHYICGPIILKQTITDTLLYKGLIKEQIFSEEFEHIINQSELSEIKTRFIEIVSGKEQRKIEVVRGKSILEAALDDQMDLNYSCQTGSCTLCKAKLITGDVKQVSCEKPDRELKDQERLLCCSYPLTDNVKFKID